MTASNTVAYSEIGKGNCGSVWTDHDANDERAMKREDGSPGRSLLNDWEIHNHISDCMRTAGSTPGRFQFALPQPHAFIPAEDTTWWSQRASQFPPGYSHCNTLISTRIPPFSPQICDRLINRYCPPALVATIRSNPKDIDCLVRPYVGRRRIQKRESVFKPFTLRNFSLHVDQMEELGFDIRKYVNALADTLAFLYWFARVDANDVEFVLAPYPVHEPNRRQPQPSPPTRMHNEVLGDHALWVLDFDCCRRMRMDGAGVEQAVQAFWRNDPYFPRPGSEGERDEETWGWFRDRFLEVSAEIVGESEMKGLPRVLIDMLEEVGRDKAGKKRALGME